MDLTKEKLLFSWMEQHTVKIMILGSPETMREVNLETANTDFFFSGSFCYKWEQRNGAVPGIYDQDTVFIKEGTYLAK